MSYENEKCFHGLAFSKPCKYCREAELKRIAREARQAPAKALLDNVRAGTGTYSRHRITAALVKMGDIEATAGFQNAGLADLMAHAEEDGECLTWTSHAKDGRFPQWRINGALHPARRAVYELVHGFIKPGHWIGVNCGNELCVHPDHVVSRTPGSLRKGKPLSLKNRISLAMGRRAKSHLTGDDIRAIRTSNEIHEVQAERYGVSAVYISHIKVGRKWVDYSSPWAGLGGRAA